MTIPDWLNKLVVLVPFRLLCRKALRIWRIVFSFVSFFIFSFVIFCASVCVYVFVNVCHIRACGSQKRVSNPVELEVQVVMRCLVWMLRTELESS